MVIFYWRVGKGIELLREKDVLGRDIFHWKDEVLFRFNSLFYHRGNLLAKREEKKP